MPVLMVSSTQRGSSWLEAARQLQYAGWPLNVLEVLLPGAPDSTTSASGSGSADSGAAASSSSSADGGSGGPRVSGASWSLQARGRVGVWARQARDLHGSWQRLLGPSAGAAVLVRPDGHVAWMDGMAPGQPCSDRLRDVLRHALCFAEPEQGKV
jgi:hypothetical protein